MPTVRVAAFSVSIDGFGAGPHQDKDNPLGVRGQELHTWFRNTVVFHRILNQPGGAEGVDNDFVAESFRNVGAWILGRNMFGPVRGPWVGEGGDEWRGWWGDEPPYRTPVFVLTKYPRLPLEMKGGTTFHFVTDGPDSALAQARKAAGDQDVRIGGGVATIRHYLIAGAIDEMHLAISPVLLGEGENLFEGLNLPQLGFSVMKSTGGEQATHIILKRS